MSKILRVESTSDQELEVRERLRARDLAPGTRLRLDCRRLMGRGLTVPRWPVHGGPGRVADGPGRGGAWDR